MVSYPSQIASAAPLSRLNAWLNKSYIQQALLFAICVFVLIRTTAPTVYELDSAEFATGASILGIVHAPGYPLYTMLAHLFTLLPVGDVAFRVNLLSAVSLALCAPILYSLVDLLVDDRRIAITTSLLFVWSYYVWSSGTAAEIYAPQLLTLALCGWSLAKMYRAPKITYWDAIRTGLLFGLAVIMVPSSVFFAPGLAICFLVMRVKWRMSVAAGLVSLITFAIPLVYFPLRASAYPDFNKIGQFDASGIFHTYNFQTVQGIFQALSGTPFHYLFFAEGLLPSGSQLSTTFSWFWQNYLGIGFVIGLIGLSVMFKRSRGLFLCWLALFVPYTYFYTCYGAVDRNTMFGPSYLVFAIGIAFGLLGLLRVAPTSLKPYALMALPILALVANFSAVDLSRATGIRSHAQAVINTLPQNAAVFGYWPDVTPLQYLHFVENQRPDVKIYDLFLFQPNDVDVYIDTLSKKGTPVVMVTGSGLFNVVNKPYTVTPVVTYVPDQNAFPLALSFQINSLAEPNDGTSKKSSDSLMKVSPIRSAR